MMYKTIIIDSKTGNVRPEFCHPDVSSGDEEWKVGSDGIIMDQGHNHQIYCNFTVIAVVKPTRSLANPVVIGII